jgi:hypothetical protein
MDHPSRERLQRFALGDLPPADATQIEEHIELCAECADVVDSTPHGPFVDALREAARGHWEAVVGNDRERLLLLSMLDVVLDELVKQLDAPPDDDQLTSQRVLTAMARRWLDGSLAYAGWDLDELAAVARRLRRLTDEDWKRLVAAYRLLP